MVYLYIFILFPLIDKLKKQNEYINVCKIVYCEFQDVRVWGEAVRGLIPTHLPIIHKGNE